jgi:phenylalanyl-tRNA synthetase beta chain
MKFTLNWLQEYVNLDAPAPEELADKLTMIGLEVDAVETLFEDLASLKTARVISAEPHPNADRLTVCKVLVGEDEFQIVCGAPNVRKDLCVVIALPGTILPGDFKIKKSKVRGVESQGMLCSERELGLSEDHTGIMELPEDTPHGQSFVEITELKDTLVEVDLTPNRPDCASVIGIAREVAGITKKQLTVPFKGTVLSPDTESFSVEVESPELCPRYAARLIRGITIGPSPWWIRKRLLSVGMRPINNIVDITNLVMMEYGQPLHAFDYDCLADKKIIVRTPRDHETQFTTLDNVVRNIDQDTLMICDGNGPVAVAGVMGGLDSEVTDKTTNVLLESACFNPVSVRRTARNLNLPSEASYRFERGVDPGGTIDAMERAVTLMCEVAGGTAEKGGIDVCDGLTDPWTLSLRISKTSDLLGVPLSAEQVKELLKSIEIPCETLDTDTLKVFIPTFRVDLEREVDLVEEVARLIGYNEIPVSLPTVDLSYPEQDSERILRNRVNRFMTTIGFSEVINYSFYSSGYNALMGIADDDKRSQHVKILNPLSEDQDVMRTSLLPGLFENIRRNVNFQQTSCRLFEIGKVFFPSPGESLPDEPARIAGILAGQREGNDVPYHCRDDQVDIYDAKGAVEALLEEMRLTDDRLELQPASGGTVEPFAVDDFALNLTSDNQTIGTIGKIKQEVLRNFGIKRDSYYFDLDFAALCDLAPELKAFSPLPVFPSVKRDIALVVPGATPSRDLVDAVLKSREKLVEHCDVFDVYQGDKIESGFKSVALSITYRSQTKTLTEKNVEKAHNKLVKLLTSSFSGSFREA